MEYLNNCPLCNTPEFTIVLETQDYFLTNENFTIVTCTHCGLKFTQPRPLPQDLQSYYQSQEYISHSNIQQGLFARLYQSIRKYTLSNKLNIIEKFHAKGKLLDMGCGTGEFLMTAKKRDWQVQGIEPNPDARDQARKNYGLSVIEPENINALPDASFDVITLWHVLEHVPSLSETMKSLQRLLKEDGLLLIAVPNSDSKDAQIYGKFWAAYDVPRHLYHFTPMTLKKLIEGFSFRLIKSLPMKFDSYYVSLLSEEYLNGRKNFVKAFFNGSRSNCWARFHQQNYSSIIFLCKKKKT